MTGPSEEHRTGAPTHIRCAVITVSDTRTTETDTGGQTLRDLLHQAGHQVLVREIIPDEPVPMRKLIATLSEREEIDVILLTGGTGLSSRDQTYETVSGLFTKLLPGYGELFRFLSYDQVGPASMFSRAVGGLVGQTVLLTMPGSPAAVELAMEKIILPEITHLVQQARR